jgi:hypothetical protein
MEMLLKDAVVQEFLDEQAEAYGVSVIFVVPFTRWLIHMRRTVLILLLS